MIIPGRYAGPLNQFYAQRNEQDGKTDDRQDEAQYAGQIIVKQPEDQINGRLDQKNFKAVEGW
ncbi:MAG: hypothetical protein R2824_15125 [Saprospiraceae bacterium]